MLSINLCKDVLFYCEAKDTTRYLCLRLSSKNIKVLGCKHLKERNIIDVIKQLHLETNR